MHCNHSTMRLGGVLRRQLQRALYAHFPQHSCSVQDSRAVRALSECISLYLREPCAEVNRLLTRNRNFQRMLESRRNQALSKRELEQHLRSFSIDQGEIYQQLLASDGRSRILATFHFGDYVYGMNYLSSLEPPHRDVLVVSNLHGTASYFRNIETGLGSRAKARTAEILRSEVDAATLSARLRAGDCSLILFSDLPSGFAELTHVNFMQRQAWFPRGPATLAIINRVPLLPVINFQDGNHNRIAMTTQIEPVFEPGEDLAACVNRITQQLVSFLEGFMQKYPEQWRYFQKLPLYFNCGAERSGAVRNIDREKDYDNGCKGGRPGAISGAL